MNNPQPPRPFGKTQVPTHSSNENSSSYTVSHELLTETHPEIVAYYTFPGLEDYVNMPSANRNIREESYLPKKEE
jgi:hypothetical protein